MTAEKVPVRIQFWTKQGMHVDVRGWLDEFEAKDEGIDAKAYGGPEGDTMIYQAGRREFVVKAHSDTGWKFHRGKPKVDE